MPRDQCIDCEQHFPAGEGLVDGRCPDCLARFKKARQLRGLRRGPAEPAPAEEEPAE